MQFINKKFMVRAAGALATVMLLAGCQKLDRPALGDFTRDSNPPGGPLAFFVAFDGNTSNPLMNAVDSIRANFAADNPLASVAGVSGRAVQGQNKKFIKYSRPNDWATNSKSFTIATWYRRNGQTQNNTGGNGPEYLASFKASNGHWSGSSLLFFLEGNNAAGAVKVMIADARVRDNWFTWEGGNTIAGLLDNNWHHVAITYNAANSTMTLYVDGVANANTRSWGGQGNINFDNSKIVEMRIGGGPGDNLDSDDWLSSTFKGAIDQFRMYTTALSAAEVQALFAGKK